MKHHPIIAFTFVSALAFCLVERTRATVLIASRYEYGGLEWGNMTATLNVATGGRITTTPNFEDYDLMRGYDAIWVGMRDSYSDPTRVLSPLEKENIAEFINTGKRVVMTGENDSFILWNQSILDVVGGTFLRGLDDGYYSSTISHPITQNAATIYTGNPGSASGGLSLYSGDWVKMYGENVLVVLDVSVFTTDYWDRADNSVFAANVAQWIATPIPEPSTLTIVLLGAFGLAFSGRRF